MVCSAVGGVGDSDSRNSPGHSGTPDGGGGDCLLCDGFICKAGRLCLPNYMSI